jgi:ABC-2 type transport system permease protein
VLATPPNEKEAQKLLDDGTVQAVLAVLPGFARGLDRHDGAHIQMLVDGTNSNTASLIAGDAEQVVGEYAAPLARKQREAILFTRSAGGGILSMQAPSLGADPRVWFNDDLHSRNYFVPGVAVNIIMLVTVMLTAMSVVRERELGTMEQLMVTPIRPLELMIGKTIPAALVGLLDMGMIVVLALLVFGVPFRGSFLLLIGGAALFLLTTLGAGLLISTISNTQQQAMMTSFLFATPTFMLSGFAFPIRNMPVAIQYLTLFNPLRYFMEVVRAIFLKGVGIDVLWRQLLVLLVFGVCLLLLSASRFRKRLD